MRAKEPTFNDGSNQGMAIKKLQAFAVEFVMVEGDGRSYNVVSKIHFGLMSVVQRANYLNVYKSKIHFKSMSEACERKNLPIPMVRIRVGQ